MDREDLKITNLGSKFKMLASQGLVTRIRGTKTGRCHQLLSTLELDYLYLLDWSEEVIDIREQYPLDLKETTALAKEVNLIHPPRSNPTKPDCYDDGFFGYYPSAYRHERNRPNN